MVQHNRVVISGTMPGGEVWSVNPKFAPPNGGEAINSYEELLEWAQGVAALFTGAAVPQAFLEFLSSAVTINTIRTESLTTAGALTQAAEVALATPTVGLQSAAFPHQVAVVTSLLTGRPGRSYRGRLYWPFLGMPISSTTLRIPQVNRDQVLATVGGLLTDMETAGFGTPRVRLAVVSQTTGLATPVTQLQVGDVLDTQRRRRDALDEQRTTVNYPVT